MTTVSANSYIGIYLTASSYANPVVINQDVTISSTQNAVAGFYQPWTIANFGSITGSYLYNGIYLGDGGLVTNAAYALISGGNAVHIAGDIGTVINNGGIAGVSSSSIGVYLAAAGGSVTNQSGGTISGYTAVELEAGGAVTNAATASITGVVEGVFVTGGAGTVVNYGNIAGTGAGSYGVELGGGGTVTNAATASITGSLAGVDVYGTGTVVNYGTIAGTGTGGSGVLLGSGSVFNAASASITGGAGGVDISGTGTVVNYGTIAAASGTGVDLSSGGAITNAASASITGSVGGVDLSGIGSLVNDGTIAGTGTRGFGVVLGSGVVINAASASITGAGGGVSGAGTVVNYGTIAAPGGNGINLSSNGAVTNAAFASITGYDDGVIFVGYGTVVNYGTISGTGPGGTGVVLTFGGSVTNAASASIYGKGQGVYLYDGTLTNAGTVIGTYGTAVAFGGMGYDRLVLAPGYKLYGIASGGTSASSTLELASAASAGTLSGLGTDFVYFTQVTIDSAALWQVTGANSLAAGTTITNSGTLVLTGATVAGYGVLINDGGITIDPSSLTASSLIGTGAVTIDPGSVLQVQGTAGSGETISFAGGGGTLDIGNVASFQAIIDGVAPGDQIIVDTTAAATFSQSGSIVSVLVDDAPLGELNFASAAQATTALTSDALVNQVICFCKGTVIATPDGEVPVENLQNGDRVLTQAGRARPIMWIGTGRVLATRGHRNAATPVIVCKGALADNVPHHDLRVTKGHSFYIDGVLIPVEFLVNHRSILWDDRAQEVEIYHIELDTHDVLLANGAPAESYRDDGNRWLFSNANSGWGRPPKQPCAPMPTGGPIVDAVWRRLLDRAGPRPGLPLTDDPDLCLLVDGERINATSRHGTVHRFTLSARPGCVRVASRAGSPAELGVARDPRMLGVAFRRFTVCRGARITMIEASDPRLEDGFHPFETDCGWRWTDGEALLPAALFDGFDGPMELALHVGATTKYPVYGKPANRLAA